MARNLWVDAEMLIPPKYFQWHLITAALNVRLRHAAAMPGRRRGSAWSNSTLKSNLRAGCPPEIACLRLRAGAAYKAS
ncbi:MAG: hypothetical protein M1423_01990 [Acidobacteria bacterium]|nr:hypothetical protein [Acidobacteriota bacterium]